jgi:hypothetical protein
LIITAVKRRPNGWEATVHVYLRVGNSDSSQVFIVANHIEVYANRSGTIILESEIADDTWTPEDGFSMIELHAKEGNN